MAKAFAKKFYSSKAWQTCRNEYMKSQHYLCEACLKRGIYKPAEIVHHIIELDPVTIDKPEISLSWNNLECVCRECHAERHEHSGGRWAEVNRRKRKARASSQRYIIGENGKILANDPPSDEKISSKL